MLKLESVKTMLMIAGISELQINFDDEHKRVDADYVYKGRKSRKRIPYQEIIDSLTISSSGIPFSPMPALPQELM